MWCDNRRLISLASLRLVLSLVYPVSSYPFFYPLWLSASGPCLYPSDPCLPLHVSLGAHTIPCCPRKDRQPNYSDIRNNIALSDSLDETLADLCMLSLRNTLVFNVIHGLATRLAKGGCGLSYLEGMTTLFNLLRSFWCAVTCICKIKGCGRSLIWATICPCVTPVISMRQSVILPTVRWPVTYSSSVILFI